MLIRLHRKSHWIWEQSITTMKIVYAIIYLNIFNITRGSVLMMSLSKSLILSDFKVLLIKLLINKQKPHFCLILLFYFSCFAFSFLILF